jgi:hypothetical protein
MCKDLSVEIPKCLPKNPRIGTRITEAPVFLSLRLESKALDPLVMKDNHCLEKSASWRFPHWLRSLLKAPMCANQIQLLHGYIMLHPHLLFWFTWRYFVASLHLSAASVFVGKPDVKQPNALL